MWGAIVGVAAASLALAALHQTLEATGLAPQKPGKPKELSEPGKGFQKKAGECLSEQAALSEQSPCPTPAAAKDTLAWPVAGCRVAAQACCCL